MVLIEGLGDEVTLVLGSFLVVIILLLAWLSTHTDDIPLIREFGIIVVELRQRHRNRQIRTEQPQEIEIPQSSREGLASAEQENISDNSNRDESFQAENGSGRDSASDGQRTDTDLSPSVSSLSESSDPLASLQQCNSSSQPDLSPDHELRITPTETTDVSHEHGGDFSIPCDNVNSESVAISSTCSGETEEETLRRRRVQYFQSGVLAQPSDCDINDGEKSDSYADNITQQQNLSKSSGYNTKRELDEEVVERPLSSHEDLQADRNSPQPLTTHQQQDIIQEVVDGDDSRIRVKLKYMNETQRFVYASPADTIGDFRRTHFQSELQDNKWVRFIFNGQDLRDDARTLQACNIENNCTMHCLVTARRRPGERQEPVVEEEDESMLGSMMYPLFTLLLLVVWYFRIFYRQYFSAMSTVCLIGISFLLGLSYVSSLRTSETAAAANTQPAPAQGSTGGTEGQGRQNHPHSD